MTEREAVEQAIRRNVSAKYSITVKELSFLEFLMDYHAVLVTDFRDFIADNMEMRQSEKFKRKIRNRVYRLVQRKILNTHKSFYGGGNYLSLGQEGVSILQTYMQGEIKEGKAIRKERLSGKLYSSIIGLQMKEAGIACESYYYNAADPLYISISELRKLGEYVAPTKASGILFGTNKSYLCYGYGKQKGNWKTPSYNIEKERVIIDGTYRKPLTEERDRHLSYAIVFLDSIKEQGLTIATGQNQKIWNNSSIFPLGKTNFSKVHILTTETPDTTKAILKALAEEKPTEYFTAPLSDNFGADDTQSFDGSYTEMYMKLKSIYLYGERRQFRHHCLKSQRHMVEGIIKKEGASDIVKGLFYDDSVYFQALENVK